MIETKSNLILDRLLDPLSRCFTPEAARQLLELRADTEFQDRIDLLADKNTEGQLSPEEREEYHTYVKMVSFISILQVKARKFLANLSST